MPRALLAPITQGLAMTLPQPRPTVLCVEDHPVNVILMQALFERRPSLRLVVATTGAQALEVARTLEPALLLLDLNLPDTHGSQLLVALRRLPGFARLSAVAVTADVTFDALGAGFDEVWTKPLDLMHVLDRIDALTASAWPAMAAG
jgi:CheY-like chemotaxis protein